MKQKKRTAKRRAYRQKGIPKRHKKWQRENLSCLRARQDQGERTPKQKGNKTTRRKKNHPQQDAPSFEDPEVIE